MWKCQALVYAPGCWRSDKGSVPQVPPRVTWPCRLRDADCVAVTSPVPQFPSQELGIPGSTPLPAPGWQCRLSPALWGCHRGWPWPCPRCRGFVQDWHKAGSFWSQGGFGGFGAIPEPPSQCSHTQTGLGLCGVVTRRDQGSSLVSQCPHFGLTGLQSPGGDATPSLTRGQRTRLSCFPTSNLWVFLLGKTRQVLGLSSFLPG